MINEGQIEIYKRYNGDVDGWSRTATKKERNIIVDSDDWYLIETLIQDIKLVKKGLASNDYSNDVNVKLISNCDSLETIEKLKALAEDSQVPPKESFFNKIKNIFKRKR